MLSEASVTQKKSEALELLAQVGDLGSLQDLKVRYLGKKGEVTQMMKSLGKASPEDRKKFGQLLNRTKTELESLIDERAVVLESKAEEDSLKEDWLDVTLPSSAPLPLSSEGSLHPVFQVQRELEDIFLGLGFTLVDGPEIEKEFYNFEALNIPATHPARDMQDTFWTTCGHLLRTHTSCIQARALKETEPPLRIVAPGKVYRYERVDASHSHTFYQMEGMMVDREVTVGHLRYFMQTLLSEIFGFEPKIRLRPGYFPFVEPGFELDIWFQGKWMELLPCGLVHPKVFEAANIDPNEWQGFAFGLGLSRLVMSRYNIGDIRLLNSVDPAYLRQFK